MRWLTLLCSIGWHQPNRDTIAFDGRIARTTCNRCGLGLERARAGWRRASDPGEDISSLLQPGGRDRPD